MALGLFLTLLLARGPVSIGPTALSEHFMLLGVTLATTGYMALGLGLLARVYHDFDPAYTERLLRRWSYNRGIVLAAALSITGLTMDAWLLVRWLKSGLRLPGFSFAAVLGLLLLILGFQTFAFTLILHMVRKRNISR